MTLELILQDEQQPDSGEVGVGTASRGPACSYCWGNRPLTVWPRSRSPQGRADESRMRRAEPLIRARHPDFIVQAWKDPPAKALNKSSVGAQSGERESAFRCGLISWEHGGQLAN